MTCSGMLVAMVVLGEATPTETSAFDVVRGRFALAATLVAADSTTRTLLGGLGNAAPGEVLVPALAVRWWLPVAPGQRWGVGLELSGGLLFTSSRNDAVTGIAAGQVQTALLPSIGGGVVLGYSPTAALLLSVQPQVRYAVNTTTTFIQGGLNSSTVDGSLDVLARLGAELFFGFLGAPRLSIELSVRVGVRWSRTIKFSAETSGEVPVQSSFAFIIGGRGAALDLLLQSLSLRYTF